MSELTQAAQLLNGQPPAEPAEGRTEQQESPEIEESPANAQPEGETGAADQTGQETEPEKQWESWMYDLEIPGTDGLTAGQFKDRIKDLHTAEEIRAQAEVLRQDAENEALSARETLKTLVDSMGLQLSQEQITVAQQQREKVIADNERVAAQKIPGWDDVATRETAKAANAELLKGYLFSQPEIDGAVDWRFQKLVNDFAQLRARVQAAVRDEVKPKAAPKSRPNRKVSGDNSPVADFKAGKISGSQAVTNLLLGGSKS